MSGVVEPSSLTAWVKKCPITRLTNDSLKTDEINENRIDSLWINVMFTLWRADFSSLFIRKYNYVAITLCYLCVSVWPLFKFQPWDQCLQNLVLRPCYWYTTQHHNSRSPIVYNSNMADARYFARVATVPTSKGLDAMHRFGKVCSLLKKYFCVMQYSRVSFYDGVTFSNIWL